jgi:hypothetical protein
MSADSAALKGTLGWLAWLADHAREQGRLVVLTPDEADAILHDALYTSPDDDVAGSP